MLQHCAKADVAEQTGQESGLPILKVKAASLSTNQNREGFQIYSPIRDPAGGYIDGYFWLVPDDAEVVCLRTAVGSKNLGTSCLYTVEASDCPYPLPKPVEHRAEVATGEP